MLRTMLAAAAVLATALPAAPAAAQAPAPAPADVALGLGTEERGALVATGGLQPLPDPVVEPDGAGGAVVLWGESPGDTTFDPRLRVTRVGADGVAGAGATIAGPGLPLAEANAWSLAVAPDGRALAVVVAGYTLWAVRLDAELQPAGPPIRLDEGEGADRVRSPDAVWDAGAQRWVVAWRGVACTRSPCPWWNVDLRTQTLDAAGTPGAMNVIAGPPTMVLAPRLAASPDGQVALAWGGKDAYPSAEADTIRLVTLTDAGAALDPRPVVLPSAAPNPRDGIFEGPPALAWHGDGWLVAWHGELDPVTAGSASVEGILAQRLSPSLQPVDRAPVVIASGETVHYTAGAPRIAVRPGASAALVTWDGPAALFARAVGTAGGEPLDTGPARVDDATPGPYTAGGAAVPAAQDGRFLVLFARRLASSASATGAGVSTRRIAVGAGPSTTITQGPADGHGTPTGTVSFTGTPNAVAFECALVAGDALSVFPASRRSRTAAPCRAPRPGPPAGSSRRPPTRCACARVRRTGGSRGRPRATGSRPTSSGRPRCGWSGSRR